MVKQLGSAELLDLGVKAAQSGLHGVARRHFINALRQDPENTSALLWLALLAPAVEDSLRLFNRVLALEPRNQQAIAGIHQARRWLGFARRRGQAGSAPAPPSNDEYGMMNDESFTHRSSFIIHRWRKKERVRGVLPDILKTLLATAIIALLALVFGGLSASLFIPPDLAAAWLPALAASPKQLLAMVAPAQPSDHLVEMMPPAGLQQENVISGRSFEPALVASQVIPALNIPPQLAETALHPPDLLLPVSLAEPSGLIGLSREPVEPALLPYQPASENEKWIEVNVATQEVTAWEGNRRVMSFLASTGQPEKPTILGQFHIYWKLQKTDMFGFDYFVPEVPYAMFFHEAYALHGTYWHNLFGRPVSRGCVNLSIADAKKLFEWAGPALPPGQNEVTASDNNPGTIVVVHE